MLAHSVEELQRRLHLDSHCKSSDPSQWRITSKQPEDLSDNQSQAEKMSDISESNTQAKHSSEQPDVQLQQDIMSDSELNLTKFLLNCKRSQV